MSGDYKFICFTLDFLSKHKNVISVNKRFDYVFEVMRENPNDKVIVAAINEYVLGVITILRITKEAPEVDIICSGGDWNKPTQDAFNLCRELNICLCNFKGLYRALYSQDCKNYVCDTYC